MEMERVHLVWSSRIGDMGCARKRKIKDDCKIFSPSYWKNCRHLRCRPLQEKWFVFVLFSFVSLAVGSGGNGNHDSYWRQMEMSSRQLEI